MNTCSLTSLRCYVVRLGLSHFQTAHGQKEWIVEIQSQFREVFYLIRTGFIKGRNQ